MGEFSLRDWERTFTCLIERPDALFVAAIGAHERNQLLPSPVLVRFEQKLADNRRRVDHLADQFDSLNQAFNRAGVNYAVIKGFALVPSFCPDPVLRATSDLDYLVDRSSLTKAQRVLEQAGFRSSKVL